MRLGATRSPAWTLILILLTCGLYYFYFIYVVSKETSEFLGERDAAPGTEVLLSVLTCGLWNIYWDYKIGKRLAQMCAAVGLPPTDNAVLYLVLDLAGAGGFASLGIINPILQQDTLNRVWAAAMTGPPPDYSSNANSWPPPPDSNPSSNPTPTPRQPRPPRS